MTNTPTRGSLLRKIVLRVPAQRLAQCVHRAAAPICHGQQGRLAQRRPLHRLAPRGQRDRVAHPAHLDLDAPGALSGFDGPGHWGGARGFIAGTRPAALA